MDIPAISLFSGCGGLDLGLRIALPGLRTVAFVEREVYVAALLAKRMEEGWLDAAPVHSDVATFDGRPWRGKVDFIFGGFPCQDLSVAGKRAGIVDGSRSGLWAHFARIVGEVRPRFVFIENVSGLLDNAAMRRVLGDLSALGFDAEWCCVRASDVGAPHRRERVFILAYRNGEHGDVQQRAARAESDPVSGDVAHGKSRGLGVGWQSSGREGQPDGGDEELDNTDGAGAQRKGGKELIPATGCDGMDYAAHRECARQREAPDAGVKREHPEPSGAVDDTEYPERWPRDGTRGAPRQDAIPRREESAGRVGIADEVVGDPENDHGRRGIVGAEERIGADGVGRRGPAGAGGQLADAGSERREGQREGRPAPRTIGRGRRADFPPGPGDAAAWQRILAEQPHLAPAVESGLRVLVDGTPVVVDEHRSHQLRATGNGVVPHQAAAAFCELWGRIAA